MFDDSRSFLTRAFLRAEFDLDYRAYTAESDTGLLQRLRDWDGRLRLGETQAEGAFTQAFFVETRATAKPAGSRPNSTRSSPSCRSPAKGPAAAPAKPTSRSAGSATSGTASRKCCASSRTSARNATPSRAARAARAARSSSADVRGARRGLFGNGPGQPRPRHRHERGPPVLVGPRAGRIHALLHPPRGPAVGRLRPARRIRRRAVRPLSLRQAVLPRHAAVGSGTAAAAAQFADARCRSTRSLSAKTRLA